MLWLVLWTLLSAGLRLREKFIQFGLFGSSSCSDCEDKTFWSSLAIFIPVLIGSSMLAWSIVQLARPKNVGIKWASILLLAVAFSYFTYLSIGILNFGLNYA